MKRHFKDSAQPGTQAVTRAVAILKTMASADHAFGLAELATALEVNKPAVFRLLGSLEAAGLVVRDEATAAYRLGPELITLGIAALGSTDLSAAARTELMELVHETGETATLEVLVGSEVLIIAEVQGRNLLGTTPELGMRWPVHATSTGKILLAFGDSVELPAQLTRRTPRTIVSRTALEREFREARKRGYAIACDELVAGFTAIAAPVRNHFGKVVAALSINGPTARLTPQALRGMAEPLCQAAERVSRTLGAPAATPASPARPELHLRTTAARSRRASATSTTTR